nr:nucleotidyltransferase family protein [Amycolatopsis lexingtonensis]
MVRGGADDLDHGRSLRWRYDGLRSAPRRPGAQRSPRRSLRPGAGARPAGVVPRRRVHLWYEAKFGVFCPPFASTEAAIDAFPAVCSCVGVRLGADGSWHSYTPHGLDDLFAMIVRPNPVS